MNFIDSLPTHIENEIRVHLSDILSRISSFKKRAAALKSGKLKNVTCSWWLNHIEKRVDEYPFHSFLFSPIIIMIFFFNDFFK